MIEVLSESERGKDGVEGRRDKHKGKLLRKYKKDKWGDERQKRERKLFPGS